MIQHNTDEQIRDALSPMLGVAAADVMITRANRHDRTSPVQAISIVEVERLTFEQISRLAGVCMTPDLEIRARVGLDVTIRWGVPLTVTVGEMVTAEDGS